MYGKIAKLTFLMALGTAASEASQKSQVLELVAAGVNESVAAGRQPVVLFDLDETLVNSRTRTLRILGAFLSERALASRYPEAAARVAQLTSEPARLERVALGLRAYPLYLDRVLAELEVPGEGLARELDGRYVDAYLSNAWCEDDEPMPGAVSYVRRLRSAGARIVYITGRNRPGMGVCTERNLAARGFPVPDGVDILLLMKPNRQMDDTDFKEGALGALARLGEVVGGFENEPANLNAFRARYPKGVYGFVDSAHSSRPDRPFEGAYWIRDYREAGFPPSGLPTVASTDSIGG